MFDNIGKKIKTLAEVVTYLGSFLCIIGGFILIVTGLVLTGILYLVLGPILCWIGSFVLYGFGELVDSTSQIALNTSRRQQVKESVNIVSEPSNNKEIQKDNDEEDADTLFNLGLIDEDEYNKRKGA